ncbi:Bacterial type II secretion system protein G [Posidoniimonas polymericola]|uniref:Bacterial type II secretion system protein G n=1 Tax=Posidoniimonas polymericola TaxID=2528002 RepID=A0A5C5YR89_9BACT|nr:type II secretion system protein GspG [Posidoniimonas polymericola]TWT77451.1 Bacterial type II secretion system protein G [Posidoniimonas polymericola]
MKPGAPKLALAIGVALACGCSVILPYVTTTIPPTEATRGEMHNICHALDAYYAKHSSLPEALSTLPPVENRIFRIEDSWDRPFEYKVEAGNYAQITSLGKDGLPGGSGEDSDLVVRYLPGVSGRFDWIKAPDRHVDF